jgi:hypothetical protein
LVRSQVLYPAELQPPEAGIIAALSGLAKPVLNVPGPASARGAQKKGEQEKKKARSGDLAFHFQSLVRLAGIEPTTPWFVAKYSIQLSYSRPMHAL